MSHKDHSPLEFREMMEDDITYECLKCHWYGYQEDMDSVIGYFDYNEFLCPCCGYTIIGNDDD